MAEVDWTYLNDGLDIATVDRGVTAGIARPPGGGNFLFAFNSLAAVEGAVALFANLVNFAPMAKGASIRGCIQRGPGGGPTGFSPFLFLSCQGNSVNDIAYLLGLSDDDPHRSGQPVQAAFGLYWDDRGSRLALPGTDPEPCSARPGGRWTPSAVIWERSVPPCSGWR